mmetsp:Transcript_20402/g.81588  ORF Transcript_20402/g.81588 Transcript_20402/m.81588 type:complete len:223 (+) Transcript_20402:995-1663(+)
MTLPRRRSPGCRSATCSRRWRAIYARKSTARRCAGGNARIANKSNRVVPEKSYLHNTACTPDQKVVPPLEADDLGRAAARSLGTEEQGKKHPDTPEQTPDRSRASLGTRVTVRRGGTRARRRPGDLAERAHETPHTMRLDHDRPRTRRRAQVNTQRRRRSNHHGKVSWRRRPMMMTTTRSSSFEEESHARAPLEKRSVSALPEQQQQLSRSDPLRRRAWSRR